MGINVFQQYIGVMHSKKESIRIYVLTDCRILCKSLYCGAVSATSKLELPHSVTALISYQSGPGVLLKVRRCLTTRLSAHIDSDL